MKKHITSISLFVIIPVLMVFTVAPYLTQDVFAAQPTITGYIANDPDDGDAAYGAGDTLTITTDIPTNATVGAVTSAAFVTGNFTFATVDPLVGLAFGVDWTAAWTDASTLVITIVNPGVNTPVVGVATVDTTGGNTIGDQTVDPLGMTNGAADVLTGDFGLFVAPSTTNNNVGGGDGCKGDCEEPTLGVDSRGVRLVSNGFTYNGHSVDVERFFTPYPLITANVGQMNKAEFKIYENHGPDNIAHFSFAFGLGQDQIISQSKAMIELDIAYDGTETVTITDPENALDNVRVETSEVSCNGDVRVSCLGVTIYHTFRAPLDFNIVATDVWDRKTSSWQNYYNHGIEVVGPSMNPPKEYDGINKGQIYHLTETSNTTAVDEFGNSWSLEYGIWTKDYVPSKKIVDGIAMNGYTRDNSHFDTYKYGQYLLAQNTLSQMCPECLDVPYDKIDETFAYDYPLAISSLENPEIQKTMMIESEKAQEILKSLLDPLFYLK